MLAIDKEMDNLRAHDAFHYVPVKEALAQGKKIMRMTWVFKIKTLDTGALDKFKARFCLNIDGKQNPADALTKHIEPKATFRDYMARLYNATATLFRFSHTTSMAHPAEISD